MSDTLTDASNRLGHRFIESTLYGFSLKKGFPPKDAETKARELMQLYDRTGYAGLPDWVKDACLKTCEGELH